MAGAVVTGTVVGVGVMLTRTAVADVFGVIVMVAAIVRAINTMNAVIVMAATAAIVMTVAVVVVMVMGAVAAAGAVGVIEGDVDSISSSEVMMKGDVSCAFHRNFLCTFCSHALRVAVRLLPV